MKLLSTTIAAVGMLMVAPTSQAQFPRSTFSHGDWGRCIGYLPESISEGRLAAGDATIVHTWKTTCHSSFSASAARGTAILQKLASGEWRNLTYGYSSYVPDLGPGTYRLVVYNPSHLPLNYRIRHRQGLG